MRYAQIAHIIKKTKPATIVEVGTWNGLRAVEMCREALKYQDKVFYLGFDLFEGATKASDERELNVKAHTSKKAVEAFLGEFKQANKGFDFDLIKGDTKKTLKDVAQWPDFPSGIDLAFIDGGHSLETIQNDFEALKGSKVVILDDYYEVEDGHPDIEKFGCNKLVSSFAQNGMDHLILPNKDPVKDGGKVSMVVIPPDAWPGKMNLVIKTKNCVSDKNIQANIQYASTLVDNWMPHCAVHDGTVVFCSGGPSLKKFIPEIKKRQKAGDLVFCVKHSHDLLIENGVIPWGCMLLDPRSHVRDFIETPHDDVRYFMASMCHPTTVDRLIEKSAQLWGYHALVGAGEQDVIKKGFIISGGSTAAVRGITVLYALGFRSFALYGYDSCYYRKPDLSVKTKTGAQKYYQVEVLGKKFWSDSELIAQAQDFDKLIQQKDIDLRLEVNGDGIIPYIWEMKKPKMSVFSEVFGA